VLAPPGRGPVVRTPEGVRDDVRPPPRHAGRGSRSRSSVRGTRKHAGRRSERGPGYEDELGEFGSLHDTLALPDPGAGAGRAPAGRRGPAEPVGPDVRPATSAMRLHVIRQASIRAGGFALPVTPRGGNRSTSSSGRLASRQHVGIGKTLVGFFGNVAGSVPAARRRVGPKVHGGRPTAPVAARARIRFLALPR